MGGNQDNGDIDLMLVESIHDLKTVHLGHFQIEQDQVRRFIQSHTESFSAVRCFRHGIATPIGQGSQDEIAYSSAIVYDQYVYV
jgi:hypothetical protein